MMQQDFRKNLPPPPLVTINHKSLTTATAMHVNHDHAVVQLSPHIYDLNPKELIQAKITRLVCGKQHKRCELEDITKR